MLPSNNHAHSHVIENEDEYIVQLHVHDMDEKDIKITYLNDTLFISGQKIIEKKVKNKGYVTYERHYGEFNRSFSVENVNQEDISSTIEDGLLTITLPKNK